MKVSEADINEALELLQRTYPHEKRYDIWCCAGEDRPYVAFINSDSDRGLKSESSRGMTAVEAAKNLILEAGDRDPNKAKSRRIAELREKLAALEAELNPASEPAKEAKSVAAAEGLQA